MKLNLQRKRMLVGALVALLMFVVMSGAVLAQSGVNIQQFRAIVVRDFATVLGTLTVSGNATMSDIVADDVTVNSLTNTGGQNNASWFRVDAPTAIATGTPAVVINNAGVSRLLEFQKGGTPQAYFTGAGGLTLNGALSANSGTFATPLAVGQYVAPTAQPTFAYTAPTVVPTATPNILYGATPVAVKEVCQQVSIIGAATVPAAGITTPQAVTYGVAADPAGNVDLVTHTNAAGVVTVKTWIVLAGTPAAATTAVPIDVCIRGN